MLPRRYDVIPPAGWVIDAPSSPALSHVVNGGGWGTVRPLLETSACESDPGLGLQSYRAAVTRSASRRPAGRRPPLSHVPRSVIIGAGEEVTCAITPLFELAGEVKRLADPFRASGKMVEPPLPF
ncbi:hypothetical protein AAFF_G00274660 [Aldrovandia affinis]|uniref:Uncharacterized protein n=1 Tax=Aldrovandia affinis TaxID=143900 RepID=A0AAD7WTD3_9TELE|nr:hypothetical protein AAFF_G00274660 [Aldrovandia affinis]